MHSYDEILEIANEILSGDNPWAVESKDHDPLRRAHEATLVSLLRFVEEYYPEHFSEVTRSLKAGSSFLDKMSELFVLYGVHPWSRHPYMIPWSYSVEYNPSKGSPDLRIKYDEQTTVGIEVTRVTATEPFDHSADNALQSVEKRISPYMKKVNAKMEEKVGKFGDCTVKVIAVDITDYLYKVFFMPEPELMCPQLDHYLYGQAVALIDPAGTSGAFFTRDPHILPAIEGTDVDAFFPLHPDVAAVIHLWQRCLSASGPDGHGDCLSTVHFRIVRSPYSPDETQLPLDLAFALCHVMNEGKPFTVSQLQNYVI